MKPAVSSISPLSPFMWDAPVHGNTTPGCKVGKIADVVNHIAQLDVNFELVVREFAPPLMHPVYDAFYTHPLHKRALNRRQFDVLRYGCVLDEDERLVILAAPRECADTGVCVEREYAAVTHGTRAPRAASPAFEEVCQHSLLPEYALLVYRVPTDDDVASGGAAAYPQPLFRLVFRNEAYNEAQHMEWCESFPLFRLRAVFVSNTVYPLLRDLPRFSGASTTPYGQPHPKLLERLQHPAIQELCDAYVKVLHGIAPAWVREKGVGPDVVQLFLSTHRATGAVDVQDRTADYAAEQLDNRVRMHYCTNSTRMQHRVRVVPRTRGMVTELHDGAFDVAFFSVNQAENVAQPLAQTARCARLLLRPTRGGSTTVEANEISAYVPEEWEYREQHVYRTAAAERLRLWVLRGLMAAEIHGIHAVLLELDPTVVLSQCVGLLWGDDNGERHGEAAFHVCRIVMETVEDYVQHSGVVWQVTVAVHEADTVKAVKLCTDILTLAQAAKLRTELQEKARAAADNVEEQQQTDASDVPTTTTAEPATAAVAPAETEKSGVIVTTSTVNEASPSGPAATVAMTAGGTQTTLSTMTTCTLRNGTTTTLRNTIPPPLVESAHSAGVTVDDATLYPLFVSLCPRFLDVVPVKTVVNLMMEKLSDKPSRSGQRWPYDHPLLAIDSCGIPCDVKRVTAFVMSFCHMPYRGDVNRSMKATLNPPGESPALDETPPALNYVEFSMLMLALASR